MKYVHVNSEITFEAMTQGTAERDALAFEMALTVFLDEYKKHNAQLSIRYSNSLETRTILHEGI